MSERDLHEWTIGRLSDHIDGGLPGSEREAVDRHLEVCVACREVRADLVRVAAEAHGLGPIEPPTDLWPAIRDRIRADSGGSGGHAGASGVAPSGVLPLDDRRRSGGGPGPAAGHARAARRRTGRLPSTPLLAAAAVVLIAVSASLAWWGRGVVDDVPRVAEGETPSSTTPVRAAATDPDGPVSDALARELERLESVIARSRERLEPGTVHVLERNLVLIERAIEDSYRALALDPENDFVRDHLERTYERKLEYLREIASIVERAG